MSGDVEDEYEEHHLSALAQLLQGPKGCVKFRDTTGRSGIPADLVKSGLQKACRQGKAALAAGYVLTLAPLAFVFPGGEDGDDLDREVAPDAISAGKVRAARGARAQAMSRARGVFTNLLRRLCVMAVEDNKDHHMGFRAVRVMAWVCARARTMYDCAVGKLRGEHADHADPVPTVACLQLLCAAAEFLAGQPHLRLLSYLKTACHLPPLYSDPVLGSPFPAAPQYLQGIQVLRQLAALPPIVAPGVLAEVATPGTFPGGGGSGSLTPDDPDAWTRWRLDLATARQQVVASVASPTTHEQVLKRDRKDGRKVRANPTKAWDGVLDEVVRAGRLAPDDAAKFASPEVIAGLVGAFDRVGDLVRTDTKWDTAANVRGVFAAIRARCRTPLQRDAVQALAVLMDECANKERLLFLYEAVLVLAWGSSGGGSGSGSGSDPETMLAPYMAKWSTDDILKGMRAEDELHLRAALDTLGAVDMHTAEGRAMRRRVGGAGGGSGQAGPEGPGESKPGGREVFAMQGAVVADELPVAPALSRLYVCVKKLLDAGYMHHGSATLLDDHRAKTVWEDDDDAGPLPPCRKCVVKKGCIMGPKAGRRGDQVEEVDATDGTDVIDGTDVKTDSKRARVDPEVTISPVPTASLFGTRIMSGVPRMDPSVDDDDKLLVAAQGVIARMYEWVACPEDVPQPGLFAQTVTCQTKALVVLAACGVVVKGPMCPATVDLVQARAAYFRRRSWHPEVHMQWLVTRDDKGCLWLFTRNADAQGRLPQLAQYASLYNFKPPAFAAPFFRAAAGKPLWGFKAVRGCAAPGAGGSRVSDLLGTPALTPRVMFDVFLHLCLRFVLGCGDTGFHNCLVACHGDGSVLSGMGLDYEDTRSEGSMAADKTPTLKLALAPQGKLGAAKHSAFVDGSLKTHAGALALAVGAADLGGLTPAQRERHARLMRLLAGVDGCS